MTFAWNTGLLHFTLLYYLFWWWCDLSKEKEEKKIDQIIFNHCAGYDFWLGIWDHKFSTLILKVIIESCCSTFIFCCCDKMRTRSNLREENIELSYTSRLQFTTEGSQGRNTSKNWSRSHGEMQFTVSLAYAQLACLNQSELPIRGGWYCAQSDEPCITINIQY